MQRVGLDDVLVLGGVGLVVLGVGLVFPPAALVVAGLALLAIVRWGGES